MDFRVSMHTNVGECQPSHQMAPMPDSSAQCLYPRLALAMLQSCFRVSREQRRLPLREVARSQHLNKLLYPTVPFLSSHFHSQVRTVASLSQLATARSQSPALFGRRDPIDCSLALHHLCGLHLLCKIKLNDFNVPRCGTKYPHTFTSS